jgi:hypothetical protein
MSNSSNSVIIVAALFIVAVIILFVLTMPQTPPGASPYSSANATTTINGTAPNDTLVAVNLTQELNNSAQNGFQLNSSQFYSTSSAQCTRESISGCNNNVPSQFICVNSQYAGAVASQHQTIYATPTVCPDFLMAGYVSCVAVQGYCEVASSQMGTMVPANSSG